MIEKIVSGGQTGADQAGLRVATSFGLESGGWIPKGFKTEKGSEPELGELYNLKEHKSDHYVPRTYANVKDSDGTIRIAKDFNSPGEICTLKAIQQYDRPYIDVSMNNPRPVSEVVSWLKDNNIKVLNVAGNRESTNLGIGLFAEKYLTEVLKLLMGDFSERNSN